MPRRSLLRFTCLLRLAVRIVQRLRALGYRVRRWLFRAAEMVEVEMEFPPVLAKAPAPSLAGLALRDPPSENPRFQTGDSARVHE